MKTELLGVIEAWDRAMVDNDADAVGAYMAEDWTIIGPDGRVNGKDRFLQLVRSGELTHDVMESHEVDVRCTGTRRWWSAAVSTHPSELTWTGRTDRAAA